MINKALFNKALSDHLELLQTMLKTSRLCSALERSFITVLYLSYFRTWKLWWKRRLKKWVCVCVHMCWCVCNSLYDAVVYHIFRPFTNLQENKLLMWVWMCVHVCLCVCVGVSAMALKTLLFLSYFLDC